MRKLLCVVPSAVSSRAPAASRPDGADGRHGLEAASELLRALANPHRLAIVIELAQGPRCVHELVDTLGISQPLASQHLRVLKTIRLVQAQRRGREIAYSLSDEHVSHIVHDAIVHAREIDL